MMRLISVVAILALSAPAHAAAIDDSDASSPLAVQALRNYARCAVERTPDGARQILKMDFRTDTYRAALSKYARGHSYCAPGSRLKFGGSLFAGSLAEALLPEALRGSDLATRIAAAPGPAMLLPRNDLESMAMCVVRAQPAAVQAIFATEPGTPQEVAAMNATGGTLPGCVRAGQKMQLNRPIVRALYALAAYRLLTDPGSPPAGN